MPPPAALGAGELPRVFLTLAALLLFAHFFGCLVRSVRLPQVVGEIVGGLLLGPTVLGALLPAAHAWLAVPWLGSLLYWLGLVLLMFVSGLEVEKSLTAADRTVVGALLVGSTVVPFAAGWAAASFADLSGLLGPAANRLALRITIATACAVTSIPVLSRIFLDLGIMPTRFAKIVLAAAMVHDVILYVALSVASGLVRAGPPSAGGIAGRVLATCVFFALALLVAPRALARISALRANLVARSSRAGYALVVCFLFAALSGILDVNVVFGAFVAGLAVGLLPDEHFARARATIKDVSLALFVPLYFAVVGFRLDLVRHVDPLGFAAFLLVSTGAQAAGTVLSARAARVGWRSGVNLGIAMNTRGGPGIVLATIAFEDGIISERFLVTLILTALVTSMLAGYWFRLVVASGRELLADPPAGASPAAPGAADGRRAGAGERRPAP